MGRLAGTTPLTSEKLKGDAENRENLPVIVI